MQTLKGKIEKSLPELKKSLKQDNDLAVPRLVKVVINTGTGRARDKKRDELIVDRLAKITGQKASARVLRNPLPALRSGKVRLSAIRLPCVAKKMYDFLNMLLNIAMPRIRDFKGYSEKSLDNMGNLTIGIREHVIFPQTADEEARDIFGFSVTIQTTAKNKAEALAFFRAIGFPFKK